MQSSTPTERRGERKKEEKGRKRKKEIKRENRKKGNHMGISENVKPRCGKTQ